MIRGRVQPGSSVLRLVCIGRVLFLAMGMMLIGGPHAVIHAQNLESGTIDIRALDCRGTTSADLGSCAPAAGAPFFIDCDVCEPSQMNSVRTDADGWFTGEFVATQFWIVRYATEIAWTDGPVTVLPMVQFADIGLGNQVTLTFVFLDPEVATPGTASLTIAAYDCSQGDLTDTSTCAGISNLEYVYTYASDAGVAHHSEFTDAAGGQSYPELIAPALVTIDFDLSYTDFDLVSAEPTQSVLLLDGSALSLVFIFTTPNPEEPVTELPETGSGASAIRAC